MSGCMHCHQDWPHAHAYPALLTCVRRCGPREPCTALPGKHEAADHLHGCRWSVDPQPLTIAQLRTAQVLCYLPVNSHFPCPGIPPGPSQQGARVQILHFQVGPASGWPAHRPRPSSATATRWQHTAMDAVHPEPVCIAMLRQQETIPHLLLQTAKPHNIHQIHQHLGVCWLHWWSLGWHGMANHHLCYQHTCLHASCARGLKT